MTMSQSDQRHNVSTPASTRPAVKPITPDRRRSMMPRRVPSRRLPTMVAGRGRRQGEEKPGSDGGDGAHPASVAAATSSAVDPRRASIRCHTHSTARPTPMQQQRSNGARTRGGATSTRLDRVK